MSQEPGINLSGGHLRLTGNIGPENVVKIRTEGERLIASQNTDLVLDLSGLGAAHSVVLSLLLCWLRLARSKNLNLRLEGVGDRLLSLAALSGLDGGLGEQLPGLSRPGEQVPDSSSALHSHS